MNLIETGPAVVTPNLSRGCPSESTMVARTVMVPSHRIAAPLFFTTTPVLPRALVGPLSYGLNRVAVKSTDFLTGRSAASAVLTNTTAGISDTIAASARRFLIKNMNLLQDKESCLSHSG